MKLYKYQPLENLWRVLDIVHNSRLFCAHWDKLNDPYEGRYEIWLHKDEEILREGMTNTIEEKKKAWRIAALSADPTHILLWSHYANGHKGVAVEVDIPRNHEYLRKVRYYPYWYTPVFSETSQTEYTMRHLFEEKGLEWAYEREYRIITEKEFFLLSKPVTRVLVGPKAEDHQIDILKKAVWRKGRKVNIVKMQCDVVEEQMRVFVRDSSLEKIARKFALQEQKQRKS
jgi:hypothetical protein